jgi:hypothetical protein
MDNVRTLTASEIEQYHTQGYIVAPEFIDPDVLARAQNAIPADHPHAATYFENPDAYPIYRKTQFTLKKFPFGDFDLNRVVVDDALLQAARTLLQTPEIRLTKGEFWAKYAGAINYDQGFHRDFFNHTLVVPRTDHLYKELTTFVYLNDVTEEGGATGVLPRSLTDDISFGSGNLPDKPSFDPSKEEIRATGPAGSVLFYSYDVFHRGRDITGKDLARFAILADYRRADAPWITRQGWPDSGNDPQMRKFVQQVTAEQRCLLDIPPPGHKYWNEQTIADFGKRYREIDLSPYWNALP